MTLNVEWLSEHERMIFECDEKGCFYSVDLYCEGRLSLLDVKFDEKINLPGDWYIGFVKFSEKPDKVYEAEYLINDKKDYWQLYNVKIWSHSTLTRESILLLREILCKEPEKLYKNSHSIL